MPSGKTAKKNRREQSLFQAERLELCEIKEFAPDLKLNIYKNNDGQKFFVAREISDFLEIYSWDKKSLLGQSVCRFGTKDFRIPGLRSPNWCIEIEKAVIFLKDFVRR